MYMIYVNLDMMMGIKTKERLLGNSHYFLQILGQGLTSLDFPTLRTVGLNAHWPNFQSSFLKMDNLGGKRNRNKCFL